MSDEMGRRVNELLREAETLKAHQRDRRKGDRARKTDAGETLFPGLEEIREDIEDAVDDLEDAFNQISEMAEDRIAQHPIASLAVAFAIGVLIGRLTKSQGVVE